MSYENNAARVLSLMTPAQSAGLVQCVADHVHGFYTCAEIGVEPECSSFAINVAESCGEYDDFPPRELALAYVVECWPLIRAQCVEGCDAAID